MALGKSIGLDAPGAREVRLFCPYEEILGKNLAAGGSVSVTVQPFRAALLLVTTEPCSEPSLEKGPYRVVRDVPGGDLEIDQLTALPLKQAWHRKLADLKRREGNHGKEGSYAALRRGGKLIGAPDRAPSYPAVSWESGVRARDSGHTYYFPLDESMVGEKLEVVLLGMKGGGQDLQPSVWLTARDLPFAAERRKIPR